MVVERELRKDILINNKMTLSEQQKIKLYRLLIRMLQNRIREMEGITNDYTG